MNTLTLNKKFLSDIRDRLRDGGAPAAAPVVLEAVDAGCLRRGDLRGIRLALQTESWGIVEVLLRRGEAS